MEIPKRKHKIFDCFLYWNEKDTLLMRLAELSPYITNFILIEFDLNFKLNECKSYLDLSSREFDFYREKIIHLKINFKNSDEVILKSYQGSKNPPSETFQRFFFTAFEEIKKILRNSDVDFEDIIMFSDVDEIPDLESIDSITSSLIFGPIILKSHNFVYTTKFYQENSHLGTQIFNYSMIVRNEKILYEVNQCKIFGKKNQPLNYIKNGWHLSHFNSLEKIVEKLNFSSEIHKRKFELSQLSESIHNLTPIFELQSRTKFKKTDITLPKNISLLNEDKTFERKIHSHFISLGDFKNIDGYDTIRFINYCNDFYLPFEERIKDNVFKHHILYPQEILYSSEDFLNEYMLNDIKLIIQLISPIDEDLITIETERGLKKFVWGDIKDSLLSEIL